MGFYVNTVPLHDLTAVVHKYSVCPSSLKTGSTATIIMFRTICPFMQLRCAISKLPNCATIYKLPKYHAICKLLPANGASHNLCVLDICCLHWSVAHVALEKFAHKTPLCAICQNVSTCRVLLCVLQSSKPRASLSIELHKGYNMLMCTHSSGKFKENMRFRY